MTVTLIKHFGERWIRNAENIKAVPTHTNGGQGVYILYDGSAPVYVGKGNIQKRLSRANNKNKRKGKNWDYFSWYILKEKDLIHDVEVLLLRILPPYLRYMNRAAGKFAVVDSKGKKQKRVHLEGEKQDNDKLIYIKPSWLR
jgi:hypothetical protein